MQFSRSFSPRSSPVSFYELFFSAFCPLDCFQSECAPVFITLLPPSPVEFNVTLFAKGIKWWNKPRECRNPEILRAFCFVGCTYPVAGCLLRTLTRILHSCASSWKYKCPEMAVLYSLPSTSWSPLLVLSVAFFSHLISSPYFFAFRGGDKTFQPLGYIHFRICYCCFHITKIWKLGKVDFLFSSGFAVSNRNGVISFWSKSALLSTWSRFLLCYHSFYRLRSIVFAAFCSPQFWKSSFLNPLFGEQIEGQ